MNLFSETAKMEARADPITPSEDPPDYNEAMELVRRLPSVPPTGPGSDTSSIRSPSPCPFNENSSHHITDSDYYIDL